MSGSDSHRKGSLPDVPFIAGGGGSLMARLCSKCNLRKMPEGGRGISPRWKCGACIALRVNA